MKDFEEMINEVEFDNDTKEELDENMNCHKAVLDSLKINIVKLSNAASPWDDDPEDIGSQLADATDILDLFSNINYALSYIGDGLRCLETNCSAYRNLAKSLYRQLENKEKEVEKLKSCNELLSGKITDLTNEISRLKKSAKSSKIIVE